MRGNGGHFIFLEEAAYLDESVIKTVVMPLLTVETTCLVGISTLGSKSSNTFNKMLNSGAFNDIRIAYICEPCRAIGMTDVCKHKIHEIPPWINSNNGVIGAIFGEDDDEMLLETKGIFQEDDSYCFPRQLVQRMMSNPPVQITEPQRFVYISIDPCAGTDVANRSTSDFCITSICKPQTTICGLDAFESIDYNTYEPILCAHIRKIRSHPMLQNATIVVDIEANGQAEWAHILKIIREHGHVIALSDYTRKEATNTTNSMKMDAMKITRAMLDDNDIRIMDMFATSNPNPLAMLKKMEEQFYNYERVIVQSTNIKTRNTVVLTGKGNNKKRLDDICLTLQRSIRSRRVFLESPKYRNYR